MRRLLAIFALGIILAGCNKNNPVDSAADTAIQSDAMFGETSMYNTTLASGAVVSAVTDSGVCVHDSLRNLRMLDSLKAYLTLSDDQFGLLQDIGATLFTKLSDIRIQVHANTITRDSAKTLVSSARTEFIASVKLIITETQLTQFDRWIALYWDKPRGGHGGGGHGHHGGGKK
ncbi:MAG: hypothetical protein HYV28_00520 [Ignavibacteriales bacterium]|nr:hypothetical protein [Ignavibacteriales bacterium]